jgi:hypothetical protein
MTRRFKHDRKASQRGRRPSDSPLMLQQEFQRELSDHQRVCLVIMQRDSSQNL